MTLSVPDLAEQIALAIEDLQKEDRDKEWEEYVPIKKSEDGKDIKVFLSESIHMPAIYNRLIYELFSATKDTKVILFINNGGGVVDSAIAICDAIKNSEATVIARISGCVASAATLITLACDEIYVADDTMFMCHESSFENLGGKFSDMKTFQTFYDRHTKEVSRRNYIGFLSESEIEDMHKGKELWFTKTETLERIARRKAYIASPSMYTPTPTRGRPRKAN